MHLTPAYEQTVSHSYLATLRNVWVEQQMFVADLLIPEVQNNSTGKFLCVVVQSIAAITFPMGFIKMQRTALWL